MAQSMRCAPRLFLARKNIGAAEGGFQQRNMVNQKDVAMPKFGKTALELLDSRNVAPKSVSEKYGVQTALGFVTALAQLMKNWVYQRPLIAGAYKYPIFFAGGFLIGHGIMMHRHNYWAERDAVMRHYIELHPEDFPPPERKKYADVLQEWIPIR